MGLKRITVDLDELTFEELSIKCIKKGKRKAEVIRELIKKWIKEGDESIAK